MSKSDYKKQLQEARARHDAWFEVNDPRPRLAEVVQAPTRLERAAGSIWAVWLVIAGAGAIISVPHTVATLRAVLPLDALGLPLALAEAVKTVYSIAGFVGVELALIGVALVAALRERDREARKVRSLKGLANWLDLRVGNAPRHDLAHLPERAASSGAWLVALLFGASLVFNQVDALRDLLGDYYGLAILVSRAVTGALGPGLLLLSGHQFAREIVKSGQKGREERHRQMLEKWMEKQNRSWVENAEKWLEQDWTSGGKSRKAGGTSPGKAPENGAKTAHLDDLSRTRRAQVQQARVFFQENPGASAQDFQAQFQLGKSTVYNILSDAQGAGLIEQVSRGAYAPVNGKEG